MLLFTYYVIVNLLVHIYWKNRKDESEDEQEIRGSWKRRYVINYF